MATKSSSVKELFKRILFSFRNQHFVYSRFINSKFRGEWQRYSNSMELRSEQRKVLDSLEKEGIAVSSVFDLLNQIEFSKCLSWIHNNEQYATPREKKKFLVSYLPEQERKGSLDLGNPIVSAILDKNVLEIVCAYLGYIPQLFEVYIEKTLPVGESGPQFSQNWHRDPEEKRTIKVFLYLSDVNSESGPFIYLKGSQPTNKKSSKYSRLFPQKLPHGSYPDSEEFTKEVNEDHIFEATAKAGTLIFCDTAGLHKGGYAKSQSRIMATAFFPSKKYSEKRLFSNVKWDESKTPTVILKKILQEGL